MTLDRRLFLKTAGVASTAVTLPALLPEGAAAQPQPGGGGTAAGCG